MNRVVAQASSLFGPNRLEACSTMLSRLHQFMAPMRVQRWRSELPVNYLTLIGCLVLGASQARGQTSAAPAADPAVGFSGKVLETTNAASYTYVLVDTGTGQRWAAAPQVAVKVGDTVAVANAMAMPNYHSKTLDRDFEVVYFTGSLTVNGAIPGAGGASVGLPKNHPPIAGTTASPKVELTGIKKAAGGKSIAEIVSGKTELKGKAVKVRGRVVKYNAGIMGKNWLHIQDGTGSAGSNDLTVTTATLVKVGDTVLVSGTVVTDRDFGGGYKYSVIIEDAKVTVE